MITTEQPSQMIPQWFLDECVSGSVKYVFYETATSEIKGI